MRITRLSWTNYKGLRDDEIVADGANVTVLGQNGVGKTTIAEMFSFILFGLDRGDTLTRYEGGRKQADDDLIHAAQVEFDDGTTIRREICNGEPLAIVNGTPMKVTAFKQYVNQLLCNADKLLFDPFYFHDDKRMGSTKEKAITNRRDLLAKIFGGLDEKEFLTPEEEKFLGGERVAVFVEHTKNRLKKLKKCVEQNETRIDENKRKLDEMPADLPKEIARLEGQIAKLQAEKKSLEDERDNLNRPLPTNTKAEYDLLISRADDLKDMITRKQRDRDSKENRRQNLLMQYRDVKNSESGRCPTCGQPIPTAQFKESRKNKMDEIKEEGCALKNEIAELDAELAKDNQKLFELGERAGSLSKAAQEQSANETKRTNRLDEVKAAIAEIEKDIDAVKDLLSDYKNAGKVDARIAELQNEQKQLNKELARLETQINQARDIQSRVVQSLEDKINSNFGSVQFKLFNIAATTGEFIPTCEAFMHDVPYSALSKGEKLKCALEVFKVIQTYYGVEMPLIIDDAESYTMNSFVELPNQKWLFKVAETPLEIKIDEKASVAA